MCFLYVPDHIGSEATKSGFVWNTGSSNVVGVSSRIYMKTLFYKTADPALEDFMVDRSETQFPSHQPLINIASDFQMESCCLYMP